MKNIYTPLRIIFGILCLIIGIDKFVPFLGGCTINSEIPSWGSYAIGVLQLLVAVTSLIGIKPRLTTYVAMGVFSIGILLHLINGTYDIGGAVFMVVFAIVLRYIIYRDTMAQTAA